MSTRTVTPANPPEPLDASHQPLTPQHWAQAALIRLESSGIPSGILSPIDVLTTAGRAGAVARQARRVPGVYTAFASAGSPPAAGTGLVEVLPVAEPGTAAGAGTVSAVRQVLANQPGVIGVGGQARATPTSSMPSTTASR